MAKTRKVQAAQYKLKQLIMESELDEAAAGDTLRSVAAGTPHSIRTGTPRSMDSDTPRSADGGSPRAAPASPTGIVKVESHLVS